MIPSHLEHAVFEAIRRGRYSLFLGAGYSCSACSSSGLSLPLGDRLREELSKEFHLPPQYSLGQITAAIPLPKLHSFFTSRLQNCRPHPASLYISTFIWRSIYTVNIDDCLWRCYENKSAIQNLEEIFLRDSYARPEDPNTLQAVYLHGCVRQSKPEYVFSAREYGETLSKDSIWFRIFADELTTQPFIIVGCAMNEPDLEYYLARRNGQSAESTQIAPSLYVTDVIDPVVEALCGRFGLIPVVMKSDDFWTYLNEKVGPRMTPGDLYKPSGPVSGIIGASASDKSQRLFLRQWQLIEPDSIPQPAFDHIPLLRGVEPTLWSLANGEDILRTDTLNFVSTINEWLKAPNPSAGCIVIEAAAGEGKSTAILRAAYELAKLHHSVFLYRGQERIIEESVIECARHFIRPTVLVVDQLGFHSRQVAGIIKAIQAESLPCFILAAERHQGLHYDTSELASLPIKYLALSALNKPESLAIVSRLRTEGLLGLNARIDDSVLANRMSGKQLIGAIVESSGGSLQFHDILKSEYDGLDANCKIVYDLVACAHSRGFGVKIAVVHRASGLASKDVISALNNLRGIIKKVSLNGEYLECRHRIVGEAILSCLPPARKFNTLVSLSKALSPYVNRLAVMRGTPEARLAGKLLDSDDCVRPLLGQRSDAFYCDIQDAWQWNSRYWEQRALDVVENNPQLALKFAEHAVGIERHPHTLTTLAKIEFEVAAFGASAHDAPIRVKSAMEHTDAAILESYSRKRLEIHPFDSAIRGLVKYCKSAHAAGREDDFGALNSWVRNLLRTTQENFGPRQRKALEDIWSSAHL